MRYITLKILAFAIAIIAVAATASAPAAAGGPTVQASTAPFSYCGLGGQALRSAPER